MTNINPGSYEDLPHVPAAEIARIFSFFREITNIIGTPRYVVSLDPEPSDEDCYASISMNDQRYHAILRVCAGWMDLPVHERRHTIIHEACHLLHHRLDGIVSGTDRLMHDHEHAAFWDAYHRETEFIVDQLTVTLADHAAPEWPDS